MNKTVLFTIFILGFALSVGFSVSRFVEIVFRVYDIWPLTNIYLMLVLSALTILIFALAIAHSLKAIKDFNQPRYSQALVAGLYIAVPLYWLLACLEVIFKY
jgi:hypothetical protein